jgi:hypothetical protein
MHIFYTWRCVTSGGRKLCLLIVKGKKLCNLRICLWHSWLLAHKFENVHSLSHWFSYLETSQTDGKEHCNIFLKRNIFRRDKYSASYDRDTSKNICMSSCKACYFYPILTKVEMSWHILVKLPSQYQIPWKSFRRFSNSFLDKNRWADAMHLIYAPQICECDPKNAKAHIYVLFNELSFLKDRT